MSWIKNLGLVTASFLVALILAEFISRFALPQDLSSAWMTKDDSGLILNKSDGVAVNQMRATKAKYYFGSPGLRIYPNLVHIKDSEKVLVLGDSFTFGLHLNDLDTYVYKLDDHYADLSFYNAAVLGWGAADYTAYLEQFCVQVKPNTIFIVFNTDDIGRMLLSNLYNYNQVDGVISRNSYIFTSRDNLKSLLNEIYLYEWLLINSNLLQLARKVYLNLSLSTVASESIEEQHFGTFITKLKEESIIEFSSLMFTRLSNSAKKCGAEIKMVHSGVEVRGMSTSPSLRFLEYAEQNSLFKDLGIEYVNLSNFEEMIQYRENKSATTIEGDWHPNGFGSDLIFKAIVSSKILESQ